MVITPVFDLRNEPDLVSKNAKVTTILSVGLNRRVRLASHELMYTLPVTLPVPLTPLPSTKRVTPVGRAGSVTTVALITTLPEKVTVSASPVRNGEALPLTWMV